MWLEYYYFTKNYDVYIEKEKRTNSYFDEI